MTPSTKHDIRLIALDLDGTLLDENKAIHPATALAVAECIRRGVKVMLATARPPRSVRAVYRALALDTLQVNYNGGLIWDELAGVARFHEPLPQGLAAQMLELARSVSGDIVVQLEHLDRLYVDRVSDEHFTETSRMFPPDGIHTLNELGALAATKLMFLGPPPAVSELANALTERFGSEAAIYHCESNLIQVAHRNTSKSAAVERAIALQGFSMRNVLAMGDAANDVKLLQDSAIGVAVANATAQAKAAAGYVTQAPSSLGVLEALQQFVLHDKR